MRNTIVQGRRLRLLREQAGLHRRELAEKIGCSTGHLKNVEIERGASGDRPGDQLSAVLVYRAARELSRALEREVTIEEFTASTVAEGVPS